MILKAPSSSFTVSSKYAHHDFLGSSLGAGSCRPPSSCLFVVGIEHRFFSHFSQAFLYLESIIWETFQTIWGGGISSDVRNGHRPCGQLGSSWCPVVCYFCIHPYVWWKRKRELSYVPGIDYLQCNACYLGWEGKGHRWHQGMGTFSLHMCL